MIKLRIRKVGNSLGVILPKKVIQRLRTGAGELVFLVEAEDGDYRLMPDDPAFTRRMGRAEKIMGLYRNTLRALRK